MKQIPVAIGLLLCEQIIVEERTRNVMPVNCFTRRAVDRFPSVPFPFVSYSIITDGQGDVALSLAIQRLDTLEDVYRRRLAVRFVNPLLEARCVFRIRDCSFPIPGGYLVSLFADGELIAQKGFLVTQIGAGP